MPATSRLPEFFDRVWFGNTVLEWTIAAGIGVAALLVLATLRLLVAARAGRYLAQRPHSGQAFVGRLLQRTGWLVVVVLAVWLGSRAVLLPVGLARIVHVALVVALSVQAVSWAMVALDFGVQTLLARRREQRGSEDVALLTAMPAVLFLGRVVVVGIVLLLALQNLGIDITAMIAGLGIGGIAIALAVQNILGDLFASLSIVLDRPFVVGDFIVVGDRAGAVEKIGLKTTRVRALSGEQLIFSNSDLLGSRVQNFKRMRERRVVLQVGVTYDTPIETLAKLGGVLRTCIEDQGKQVRFDRAHFKGFGASSLDLEAVYWVLDPEFNVYMDLQQSVNLDVCRRFAELGVAFAFPTRTVHVVQPPQTDDARSEVAVGATAARGLAARDVAVHEASARGEVVRGDAASPRR